MTVWWITPWIITFFVLTTIWLIIIHTVLQDFCIKHIWPLDVLLVLTGLWLIPLFTKIVLDFVVPLFLLFWFSFKS